MSWREHAACAHAVDQGYATPDMWFPKPGGHNDKALAICASCPVAAECLTYLQSLPPVEQMYGIWGGMTVPQRRIQRRGYTRDSKHCHACDGVFYRPAAESPAQWVKRKYCSSRCAQNGRRRTWQAYEDRNPARRTLGGGR